ncbi:trypsin-like peptidase domain-containing protein [Paenibacillus antri]|uniref:Trypsin-like peptidase domain-containing protein n=2 Tax=Paenibacillus antri TaxID=2582848 RepID=A0A5R9G7W8_9BACL|nr:trypsin-like peptidase domain-containing protein [Paenibacillus antri]
MKQILSPAEQIMHSTIRIECRDNQNRLSTGTGFFFSFTFGEDKTVPVIVTNKHVVRGAVNGSFHINIDKLNHPHIPVIYETYSLSNFENQWLMHPEADVDLCVLPIAPLLNSEKHLFTAQIPEFLIPTEEDEIGFTAIEDIIMAGYPNGLWDSVNNAPIFRRGVTATHPSMNYNGKEEFMIDCACFPGSSGSPVLLWNVGMFSTRDGNAYVGNRIKLLGVLYAGPQHTVTGEIQVVNIPTTNVPISRSTIPNNLGYIIKAKKLLNFKGIIEKLLK